MLRLLVQTITLPVGGKGGERQEAEEGAQGRTQSLRGSRGYPGTPQDLVRSQGDLLGHLALEGQ